MPRAAGSHQVSFTAASTLGLKLFDIGAQIETQEDTVSGDVKPSFNVAEGLDPASMAIPVARLEGVTAPSASRAWALFRDRRC